MTKSNSGKLGVTRGNLLNQLKSTYINLLILVQTISSRAFRLKILYFLSLH